MTVAIGRPVHLRPHARLNRDAMLIAAGVVVAFIGFEVWLLLHGPASALGGDYSLYMSIARRVLGGGPLYAPYQLAGPYTTMPGDSMYPPYATPLFVAFTFLPALAWWAIPIGVFIWAIWQTHPGPWTIVAILALLAWPTTPTIIVNGNPVIWAAAGLALSIARPAWSIVVLLKPSVFPFALVGIRSRAWWIGAGILGLVSLAMLPLSIDWLHVVLNARGEYAGPLYSLSDVPLLLIPLVARVGECSLGQRLRRTGTVSSRMASTSKQATRVASFGALSARGFGDIGMVSSGPRDRALRLGPARVAGGHLTAGLGRAIGEPRRPAPLIVIAAHNPAAKPGWTAAVVPCTPSTMLRRVGCGACGRRQRGDLEPWPRRYVG